MRYWLLKSEPDSYSIDDLARDGVTCWNSVRNYQARNFMRDVMRVGDNVLFYHSSANPPGIAGLAEVVRSGYPDHTALYPDDPYFDPKATDEDRRWYDVRGTGARFAAWPVRAWQRPPAGARLGEAG